MDENPNSNLNPGECEPCREFSQQMHSLVADELERPQQIETEAHAQSCEACGRFLNEYRELSRVLAAVESEEASPELLVVCRRSLTSELDELEVKADESRSRISRWLRALSPVSSLTVQPIAAGTLLFLGFAIGILVPRWVGQQSGPAVGPTTAEEVQVADGPEVLPVLNEQDLRTANITGINWEATAGGEPPEVQVQLQAERPMTVQGTVANNNVKDTLLYILQNDRRCGPDVRIESVELLKPRSKDADVRRALCQVVRTDVNAAVRLKALECLNDEGDPEIVQKTLEDVLVADSNPGVRIEAINTLRNIAAKNQVPLDAHLVKVLRERALSDPSTYIRLQSAALIQDLGPKQSY